MFYTLVSTPMEKNDGSLKDNAKSGTHSISREDKDSFSALNMFHWIILLSVIKELQRRNV